MLVSLIVGFGVCAQRRLLELEYVALVVLCALAAAATVACSAGTAVQARHAGTGSFRQDFDRRGQHQRSSIRTIHKDLKVSCEGDRERPT